jgi:hypothetical protein
MMTTNEPSPPRYRDEDEQSSAKQVDETGIESMIAIAFPLQQIGEEFQLPQRVKQHNNQPKIPDKQSKAEENYQWNRTGCRFLEKVKFHNSNVQ